MPNCPRRKWIILLLIQKEHNGQFMDHKIIKNKQQQQLSETSHLKVFRRFSSVSLYGPINHHLENMQAHTLAQ